MARISAPNTLSGGRAGWIYISDLNTQSGEPGVNKVYQDAGNTVLQSVTASSQDLRVSVRASYPLVKLNGAGATLDRDPSGGYYAGSIDVTLAVTGPITAVVVEPDGADGAIDTCAVTIDPAPQILTLSFVGSYPGSQTELKAGDTFQVSGTTDKPADAIEVLDYEAAVYQLVTVPASTAFTITITIADRGDAPTARPVRVRARSVTTGGFGPTRDTNQTGGTTDGVDVVTCSNLYPSIGFGPIEYPGSQQALKNSESATMVVTVVDYTSVSYDSPTGELVITHPTALRIGGGYNVSVPNYRVTANRAQNDATTVDSIVINIANTTPIISVLTSAGRLRSGGNDGTAAQNHTITISSNQQLLVAPTLQPGTGSAGTFVGAGFTGGPNVWTRPLQVHDDDDKGTKSWQNLSATNLAGITTTTISTGTTYVLGGFVPRTLFFPPFVQATTLNVMVTDYAKLNANIFTSTDQPALRNPTQGDTSDIDNTYTVLSPLGTNPQTVWWNDVTAASTNSSGTAAITDLEETV